MFQDKAELSFEISDKKYVDVIRKNIASFIGECEVSVEKKSDRRNYLILSGAMGKFGSSGKELVKKATKIVVPDSVAYEISSRMLLLNKTLKVPERNDE